MSINILYYISGYDACGYYRIQMVAKYLNKLPGIVAKIASSYEYRDIKWADIIVLQKQSNPKALSYIRYAKSIKKKIVTEVDDDYFNIPPWNPAHKFYTDKGKEIIKFYDVSDALTVTTEHLKNLLSKYCSNIAVLPNSLDLNELDKISKQSFETRSKYLRYSNVDLEHISLEEVNTITRDKTIIGWGGSPTHLKDLLQTGESLKRICNQNKNVVVMMMGSSVDTLMNSIPKNQLLTIQPVPVFVYHQILSILNWDIGICPIEDNVFNRSKSNLKYLEFGFNKMACVCSNVENYAKTVEHGVTGLLAKNNTDSWYLNLKKLVDDIEYRKQLGQKGYNFIKDNFDIKNNVLQWLDFYKSLLK